MKIVVEFDADQIKLFFDTLEDIIDKKLKKQRLDLLKEIDRLKSAINRGGHID